MADETPETTVLPASDDAAAAAARAGAVADLSDRAIQIARYIDRLPPGFNYSIHLEKPGLKAENWIVKIMREERLHSLALRRGRYFPE